MDVTDLGNTQTELPRVSKKWEEKGRLPVWRAKGLFVRKIL